MRRSLYESQFTQLIEDTADNFQGRSRDLDRSQIVQTLKDFGKYPLTCRKWVPPAGFEPAAFCSGGRRSIP